MECKIYYTRMVCAPDSVYEVRPMINPELLTGRYRIRNGEMLIEYMTPKFKWLFMKQRYEKVWIHESKIIFEEIEDEIFECGKGN